ncbi:MAG: type II toxin-antitoxin system HicB family antitoxin [Acidobacteriota bacterium]|nr:type II toxin-antitoxin system HicB family antitoxin [Acidobacteriota bacterium]
MKHKGYEGIVTYDEEADILHGEVINTRDVITFQGTSLPQLKKAFKESVEDYLAFCKERGEEPDKPFTGNFVVRIPPDLHRKLYADAKREGKSLNALVEERLSAT